MLVREALTHGCSFTIYLVPTANTPLVSALLQKFLILPLVMLLASSKEAALKKLSVTKVENT
jgi:hypothetical protein